MNEITNCMSLHGYYLVWNVCSFLSLVFYIKIIDYINTVLLFFLFLVMKIRITLYRLPTLCAKYFTLVTILQRANPITLLKICNTSIYDILIFFVIDVMNSRNGILAFVFTKIFRIFSIFLKATFSPFLNLFIIFFPANFNTINDNIQ